MEPLRGGDARLANSCTIHRVNFAERRRHVRVIPRAELPLKAMIPGRGILQAPISVLDVSVGGVGVARSGPFATVQVGETLRLKLTFANYGVHEVTVEVRRFDPFVVGLQFVDASHEMVVTASRYVSELLERGAAA